MTQVGTIFHTTMWLTHSMWPFPNVGLGCYTKILLNEQNPSMRKNENRTVSRNSCDVENPAIKSTISLNQHMINNIYIYMYIN